LLRKRNGKTLNDGKIGNIHEETVMAAICIEELAKKK
jgi:hypothetical protein